MKWFGRNRHEPKPAAAPRSCGALHEEIALRDWLASGGPDYANTRGVYVYRKDRAAYDVVRIFLAGSRPLKFDKPDTGAGLAPTLDEYIKLQRALSEALGQGETRDRSAPTITIYEHYISVIQGYGYEPNILSDGVLDSLLEVLRDFQGWEVMPVWEETSYDGPPQPRDVPVRWQLGRH